MWLVFMIENIVMSVMYSGDSDRDVFNEKPSKEEQMAATKSGGGSRVSQMATLHTSMGDVQFKLFLE